MASVTYSLGYKVNLPKYENATPFFSITRDVGEGDTEAELLDGIIEEVEARLFAKVKEFTEAFGK